MPPITRADRDRVFAADGTLISDTPVQTDITAETISARAANALGINHGYLALAAPTAAQATAQVAVLTRECSALIRLLLGLVDDASDT